MILLYQVVVTVDLRGDLPHEDDLEHLRIDVCFRAYKSKERDFVFRERRKER